MSFYNDKTFHENFETDYAPTAIKVVFEDHMQPPVKFSPYLDISSLVPIFLYIANQYRSKNNYAGPQAVAY